jgi:hypothetical protein
VPLTARPGVVCGLQHRLLDTAVKNFKGCKHIFMYRDIVQVVESFQSIFYYEAPWHQKPSKRRRPPARCVGVHSHQCSRTGSK